MPQLICYACPVGPLAQQIAAYFESSQRYGLNAAHAYMPHCTLTGFFADEESAIAGYVDVLERLLLEYRDRIPHPPIAIKQLILRTDWHGLTLEADWLKQLVADFAMRSKSTIRLEPIRLKDWLHLSLAYTFNPDCERELAQLASNLIDLSIPVSWELRFYQRKPGNRWQCHRSWVI